MLLRKGQFDCENCPKNRDPAKGRFCPAWFDGIDHVGRLLTEKNPATGIEHPIVGCFYVVSIGVTYSTYARADSTVAEVSAMRSETVEAVAGAVLPMAIAAQQLTGPRRPELTDDRDTH